MERPPDQPHDAPISSTTCSRPPICSGGGDDVAVLDHRELGRADVDIEEAQPPRTTPWAPEP
jgi:hypothetical protein